MSQRRRKTVLIGIAPSTMDYAIAILFFAAGVLLLRFTLTVVQTRRRIARDWVSINAVVIKSNVELRGPWANIIVTYGYYSKDVYFEREETLLAVFPFSRQQEERLANRYSSGDPVTAYVDPDNYQASTLLVTPLWIDIASFTCAVICLCVGAAVLVSRRTWD